MIYRYIIKFILIITDMFWAATFEKKIRKLWFLPLRQMVWLPKIALFCWFLSTVQSRGSNNRGRYNPFLLGDTKESYYVSLSNRYYSRGQGHIFIIYIGGPEEWCFCCVPYRPTIIRLWFDELLLQNNAEKYCLLSFLDKCCRWK